jgi:hypothetical protein
MLGALASIAKRLGAAGQFGNVKQTYGDGKKITAS